MVRKSLFANCTKNILWVALLGVAQSLFAGVPAGYYSRIDGEKQAELKSSVKACINTGKKTFSYDDLWGEYPYTDYVIGTENQVFDYYSPCEYFFPYKNGQPTGGIPSGMNKEHACPQSWWGKGSKSNCYSDLFNVMPSNSQANSAKSNYPLGVVKSDKVTYQNERMKVGTSARSQYQGAVFEPCDEDKGDFARVYFYVATMYDQSPWQSNTNVAFNKESYPTVKSWILDLLLQWHREDPVSEWEVVRNERVYGRQKNRNPYIDYPQLVEYIWGDSTEYAFDLTNAKVNGYGYTGGGGGNDTIIPDPPVPPVPPVNDTIGTILFEEDFAGVLEGNNTNSSGSSTPWDGNDNFSSKTTVYQAGGAVRLGSSSKAGSLTTNPIAFSGENNVTVRVDVKGWSTVEGTLKVSLGSQTQQLAYEAKMSDDFQTIRAVFQQVTSNPVLKLETSTKRCFLDNIVVYVSDTSGIETLEAETVTSVAVDLQGRPCPSSRRGLQVRSGKIVLQK